VKEPPPRRLRNLHRAVGASRGTAMPWRTLEQAEGLLADVEENDGLTDGLRVRLTRARVEVLAVLAQMAGPVVDERPDQPRRVDAQQYGQLT
jgi:hypothetical protein